MRRVCFAVMITLISVAPSHSSEWWYGNWKPEGSNKCMADKSIAFTSDGFHGWEWSCKIKKQQKIKGIDNAVIMDFSCATEGVEEDGIRNILLRLNEKKIIVEDSVFEKCSPEEESDFLPAVDPVVPASERKALCPPESAVFEAHLKGNVRQELKVSLGEATLKEFRYDKLAWVAKGEMSCTNGTWVCYLAFKDNLETSGENADTVFFGVVTDEGGNAKSLVAPGWRENLYWKAERTKNRDGQGYNGGLVVEWLNGYSADPDEPNGIPASVFASAQCPAASSP